MTNANTIAELTEIDRRHWLHPVVALQKHEKRGATIWDSADGIHLTDVNGHRVQDAFGLANYRFDKAANRVERVIENGAPGHLEVSSPTNILVLREGKVYFEGSTEQMLHSSDEYLKTFLASAE